MALRTWIALGLLWGLPLALTAEEAAPSFRIPYTFSVDGVELRVVGAEVTPDQRNFLAHVQVRETLGRPATVSWQSWFAALTTTGERLRPPTDVGVDDGSGLKRVFGPRPLPAKGRLRLMIYWPIYPHERPIRLWVQDGSVSRESWK